MTLTHLHNNYVSHQYVCVIKKCIKLDFFLYEKMLTYNVLGVKVLKQINQLINFTQTKAGTEMKSRGLNTLGGGGGTLLEYAYTFPKGKDYYMLVN